MHHSFIDKYSNRASPIHRLDARFKIALTFLIILSLVVTPPGKPILYIMYALLAVILLYLSKLPLKHVLSRLVLVIPFIVIMGLGLGAKHQSLFIYTLIRSILALTFLILLTSTTPFPKLLEGLRWYKLPQVLHSLLSFMYRFIYIIIDEFQRLNRGRKSREFGKNLSLAWRSKSQMIGTFFIRSIERSERVYQAMLARGYYNADKH